MQIHANIDLFYLIFMTLCEVKGQTFTVIHLCLHWAQPVSISSGLESLCVANNIMLLSSAIYWKQVLFSDWIVIVLSALDIKN